MKQRTDSLRSVAAVCLVSVASLLANFSVTAATISKNNTSGNLNTTGVWVGGAVPGSGDVAQWDSNDSSQSSASLGGSMTWLGIRVSNNVGAASYTINSTAGTALTLGASGIDMSVANKDFTVNSVISLGATQTWNVASGRTLTVGGNVTNNANLLTIAGAGTVTISGSIGNGSGGLTMNGPGFLTLSGVNTYTGSTTINDGTLSMTGVSAGGKISSSSMLVLGGGVLSVGFNNDGTQTFNGVAANSGASAVTSSGGSAGHPYTLTLGSIVRTNSGAAVDFSPGGSGSHATTSTNVSSILGAFATLNGADWASVSSGTLSAPSYTTLPSSGSSATVNYSLTGSSSLTADESVNTLKLTTSANGQSLNLGGRTLTFSGNGVLFVGGNNYTISNGNWTAGNSLRSYELIVHHYGTGNLTNSAVIKDNGTNAVSLTFSGTGRIILNAANTYSGGTVVNAGTNEARVATSLGGGGVRVHSGATLVLDTNTTMATSASLLLDGSSPSVNMNYSGTLTQTVAALSFDGGVTYQSVGTWGSTTSTAANKDSRFTGSGILRVVGSTTTTVGSSVNPSVFGQSVTFTATVTGTGGTPTGTVTFKDGATTLGTGTLNGSGQATYVTSALSVGSHSITAVYAGDSNFTTSTGTLSGSQTVNQASTITDDAVTYQQPQISYVGNVGSVASNLAGTTLQIPVGSGGVSTGNTIVVGFASRGSTTYNTPVISDSATNTYLMATNAITYGHGRAYLFYAHVDTALANGNNITITTSSVSNRVAVASVFSGLMASSVLDQALGNPIGGSTTTNGNNPTVGPTGSTVQGNELVIGVIGTEEPTDAGAGTWQNGFTAGPQIKSSGNTTYEWRVSLGYNTVSTTGTFTAAKIVTNNPYWAATIATFKAAPAPTGPNPICSGQPATFTATVTVTAPGSGTPTGTVTFKDGVSTLGTGTLNGSGQATYTTSSLSVGSHSITAVYAGDSNFTSSTSSALSQTINAIPSAPTASNDGPICAGSTLNLTASTVSGATYSWTGPNGFTSSAQNPSIPNATTAVSGTYNVTVTVNGCTSAAGTTTATVNAIPSAPTTGNDGPICAGSTLHLTASTVSGATYSWTGPNGFTSSAQNPSIPNATTAATGTYNVTVTVNGCTSAAGSTTATVKATPSAPTAGNDGPICAGSTLHLTASTVSGATYSWTGPNGFTSSAQNPSIPNATTAASGTYNVTVTVNGCTSAAGTTTATVNAIPSAPTTGNDGPICAGSTLHLTASTVSGATYSWTGPNGFSSSEQNPSIANTTSANAGNYTVTVTVNGCTSAAATTTATIHTAPEITCPSNIVVPSGAGQCSSNVMFAAVATGTPQPAAEYAIGSTVITAPYSFPAGQTTVNCTASNDCGIVTCSFTVTVNDSEPPTITCPADVTTNTDAGLCSISGVVLGTPTTSDNCGGTVTVVNNAPSSFPTGTNLVVWTATDGCANSTSCTQQVIVVDTEVPTISACPAPVTVSCASEVPAADINSVTATDNCTVVTVSFVNDAISNQTCPNRYTVTRTYQATDAAGNSATCTQTITVDDEIAPVITASPADTTVSCASAVPPADDNAVVATDDCGTITVTHDADVISNQSCPNRYTISRTYHVTDACGNTTSATQTIIVDDEIAPDVSASPADTTVTCASAVPSADDNAVVASDNCGGAVTVTHDADVLSGQSCPNRYTISRTYHVADVCGNSTSVTQTITVNDNTGPVLSGQGADTSIETPATPEFTAPSASDNCSVSPEISFSDLTNQLCGTTYSVTRTWTATDNCGNTAAPVSQIITVHDTTAPLISCPADVTTNTDLGQCSANGVVLASPTTSDNSGGTVTVINNAPTSFPAGTNLVVWTATDGCANSTSCTQQVIVVDNEPPTISACPAPVTISCASEVPAADINSVTATDNCTAVTVSFVEDVISAQTCPNRYTITRTYQATDAAGNGATCTQTITVDDETPPVITTSPADTTVSCASAVPAADDNAVVATDNCGTITVTHDADVISNQTCANRYTISRTYHVTDASGNTTSATQTITVDDEIAPDVSASPADTTVTCASSVPAADDNAVVASDNCGGAVTVTHDADVISGQSCPNRYTISRTYHVADVCGNSASVTQTITVNDSTAPVLSGVPADATVACDAVPLPGSPTAVDNCDPAPTISYNEVRTYGVCSNSYTLARTWTATDSCGNSSSQTQLITVENCLPPALLRIVAITREGNDIRVTWTAAAGSTTVLQATSSLMGNLATDFTDVSQAIVLDGCGAVTTNYVEVGGASSTPARYYRVRLVP